MKHAHGHAPTIVVFTGLAIALLELLFGCGTAQDAKDEQTKLQAKEQQQASPGEAAPPKDNIVEYRKEGEAMALAINDTSDLPTCELRNNKQLVYVKNADTFLSCEQGTWQEIKMSREGAAGAAGQKGEKGDQGEKGEKGDPGTVATGNIWPDPVTGKRWLIGPTLHTFYLPSYGCSAPTWRLPTGPEAFAAVTHGLGFQVHALSGPSDMYTSSVPANPATNIMIASTLTGVESDVPSASAHGLICIAN